MRSFRPVKPNPRTFPRTSVPWNGTIAKAGPIRTLRRGVSLLTVSDLDRLRKERGQFLDLRAPAGFAGGHIPGSISLWRGGISSYAGWFLNYDDPIVLIDDYNQEIGEVTTQLFRMGYDNIAGILAGGIGRWYNSAREIGTIGTCTVRELKAIRETGNPFILDVRDIRNRRAVGHIPGFAPCLRR